VALRLAGSHAVEDLVERLVVDIAEYDIEILAEWYVSVAMDDKATHDALTAKAKMPIKPLVVEGHKVVVLRSGPKPHPHPLSKGRGEYIVLPL
jgi:hypothetical protein